MIDHSLIHANVFPYTSQVCFYNKVPLLMHDYSLTHAEAFQFSAQPVVLINVETAGNIFLKLSPDLHMIVLLTQFIILITKNNFLCHFQGKPSGGSVHLLSN